MDLPQIGAHCSWSSCKVLDFLPITCRCGGSFCSQHISADLHACSTLNANTNDNLTTFSNKIQRCALPGCEKPSLQIYNGDVTCSACHNSFCADHRHAETHHCPSTVADESLHKRKTASQASGKPQMPPGSASLPMRKPPTDPAKLAQWQKMEVLKMRHQASPADPKHKAATLPPDQRLHVKVMVGDAQKVFWFPKTVITGRALDLLATQLSLRFSENHPLQLCKLSTADGEELISLRNDQLLANQIEDGGRLAVRPLS